jgi:tetratricopeptide (TPR) repeat protein
MTPPDDDKPKTGKPETRPPPHASAGRSASARSIGEELGDLDFEPDALLDSLLSDEPKPAVAEAKPPPEPVIPKAAEVPSVPKAELPKPPKPEPSKPTAAKPPAPPRPPPPKVGAGVKPPRPAPPRPPRPAGKETSKEENILPPPPVVPSDSDVISSAGEIDSVTKILEGPKLHVPETRMFDEEESTIAKPVDIPLRPPPTTPSDSDDDLDALLSASAAEAPPLHSTPRPPAGVESKLDTDFDELKGPVSSSSAPLVREVMTSESTISAADLFTSDGSDIDELVREEFGSETLRPAANDEELPDEYIQELQDLRPPGVPTLAPPSGGWVEERAAATHLAEQDVLDVWLARAQWMENEAKHGTEPHAKARALLMASELWSMAGDTARAREVANEALALAPTLPVAQRQARALAMVERDWKAVSSALDVEARLSPSVETRAHAMYVGAEVQRLQLKDKNGSDQKLEALAKAVATDVRPHLMSVARQLGQSAEPPKPSPSPTLAVGVSEVARLRGQHQDGDPELAAVAFEDARRSLAAGDRVRAGRAIATLSKLEGFESAARWLAAALLAPAPETRARSIELLTEVLDATRSPAARRALAARAVEQGDAKAVEAALGTPDDPAPGFTPADRVALAVLSGGGHEGVEPWLEPVRDDPRQGPLAHAAASAVRPVQQPISKTVGDARAQSEIALGRAIIAAQAENADPTLLHASVEGFVDEAPDHALVRVMALEIAARAEAGDRVANAIAQGATEADDSIRERDRHLAAALIHELSDETDAASREYAAALRADAGSEAATRALLGHAPQAAGANLLVATADAARDDVHKSMLILEAALRLGLGAEATPGLLDRAVELTPNLPFAYRMGLQHARANQDADELVSWLRRRREASDDPVEQALDSIREALMVADTDLPAAAELLESASRARPADVTLHELHERLAPQASASRGTWREEVAATAEGADRMRLLLEAALEYERADDRNAAARAALAAAELNVSSFAATTAERLAAFGAGAARLSETLLERARASTDPVEQRELYQRLNYLDDLRGDRSSALLWQSAILEIDPEDLGALRALEHVYIGDGRVEELEPIATAAAKILDRNEAIAHAILAVRLKTRQKKHDEVKELVDRAAAFDPPSIWALREKSAVGRAMHDDEAILAAERLLSELSTRAIDAATLALRAGEAAARLEKLDDARQLLDRAVEMVPEHLVALDAQSEVFERAGAFTQAAEALETLASASAVDQHRLEAWHRAGVIWTDKVDNQDRGMVALERAALIDLTHADLFTRLRAIYVAKDERAKLAQLLERRLDLTDDPVERVALEVTRGRALAEVGDRAAAKAALGSALDANPDHVDALDAFAEVCVAEEDWNGAEEAWIRLARYATEPERQAEIYRRLGRLYEDRLPNPQRAELSYREVLKRLPNDLGAMERLVQVYGQLGDNDRAVQMQMDLLNRANTPEEKRDRTLQLARVQELILNDRRKAEVTLDKSRKTWPQDGVVLRALADFHRRGNETAALNVLLDRSANDARRALATGRFDTGLFEALATVAELRGGADAARVATATIAALNGETPEIKGAGIAAADARLDDLLAPDLLTLPLRALLKKSGDALDGAFGVDLRGLRAAPLAAQHGAFGQRVQQLATGFGLHSIEIYISPALGPVCMPVSSAPPRLALGSSLLDHPDHAARDYLILRALKILQGRAATLSRTAPIDLWPLVAAFLGVFAPDWHPQGVDAKRVADAQSKIRSAIVRRLDDDVPVLALEVIGSIGSRASQLGTAVNQWGNRVALLAVGDPAAALMGISLASGHPEGPPADKAERQKWVVRNPEARDLAVFSVSEQYAEARKQLGLAD